MSKKPLDPEQQRIKDLVNYCLSLTRGIDGQVQYQRDDVLFMKCEINGLVIVSETYDSKELCEITVRKKGRKGLVLKAYGSFHDFAGSSERVSNIVVTNHPRSEDWAKEIFLLLSPSKR